MSVVKEAPKVVGNALTAKAGRKIWESLSPQAKRRLIRTNAGIIGAEMARNFVRDPKKMIIAGAVSAGIVLGIAALLRKNKRQ
jgi:hypothetical protein